MDIPGLDSGQDPSGWEPVAPVRTENEIVQGTAVVENAQAPVGIPESTELSQGVYPEYTGNEQRAVKTASNDGEAVETGPSDGRPVDAPVAQVAEEDENGEDDESESEEESSSGSESSESSEESSEGHAQLTEEERRKFLALEDDEDGADVPGNALKTKHEEAEPIIEPPAITLPADSPIELLGKISSVTPATVIIRSEGPALDQVADQESLVVFQNRSILGMIADTFGPIKQPFFCVRFRSEDDLKKTNAKEGDYVYLSTDYTKYVDTYPLRMAKGSDASNIHDEEISESEAEFSDDEKEAERKRRIKRTKLEKKKQQANQNQNQATHVHTKATTSSYNPLSRPKASPGNMAAQSAASTPHSSTVGMYQSVNPSYPPSGASSPQGYPAWTPMILPNGAHVNPAFQRNLQNFYAPYGQGQPASYTPPMYHNSPPVPANFVPPTPQQWPSYSTQRRGSNNNQGRR